jgi:hypothetical protein
MLQHARNLTLPLLFSWLNTIAGLRFVFLNFPLFPVRSHRVPINYHQNYNLSAVFIMELYLFGDRGIFNLEYLS